MTGAWPSVAPRSRIPSSTRSPPGPLGLQHQLLRLHQVRLQLQQGRRLAHQGWSAGANLPSVGVRLGWSLFPRQREVLCYGGRSSDVAGSDFTNPFEYDPSSNSWATKGATYPDNQVNNMACGVLIESGNAIHLLCGRLGSRADDQLLRACFVTIRLATPSRRLVLWTTGRAMPQAQSCRAGFAGVSNKLYILGGFNINVASTNQIWQFDPTACCRC